MPNFRNIPLDSRLTQWAQRGEPGCAIGVIESGKLVFSAGFGVEDLAARIPITVDSRFDIASEAKQFTAACIVLLERERLVSLNDEIGGLLPELPQICRHITVAQLLHHTSGLPDFFHTLRERRGIDQPCVLRDVYEMICAMTSTNFPPGAQFGYSNSGYALLAMIAERVEGKPFGKILEERIFRPLGMTDSFVHDTPNAIYARHAKGHSFDAATAYRECWHPAFAAGGAGCLYSSVRDLARWMNGLYGGTFAGSELLEKMLQPGQLNDGSLTKYGLGLDWGQCFTPPANLRVITHGGTHGGSRAIMLHLPEYDRSIVLLCNNQQIDHASIALELAQQLSAQ